jgi:hypothetical protein
LLLTQKTCIIKNNAGFLLKNSRGYLCGRPFKPEHKWFLPDSRICRAKARLGSTMFVVVVFILFVVIPYKIM